MDKFERCNIVFTHISSYTFMYLIYEIEVILTRMIFFFFSKLQTHWRYGGVPWFHNKGERGEIKKKMIKWHLCFMQQSISKQEDVLSLISHANQIANSITSCRLTQKTCLNSSIKKRQIGSVLPLFFPYWTHSSFLFFSNIWFVSRILPKLLWLRLYVNNVTSYVMIVS